MRKCQAHYLALQSSPSIALTREKTGLGRLYRESFFNFPVANASLRRRVHSAGAPPAKEISLSAATRASLAFQQDQTHHCFNRAQGRVDLEQREPFLPMRAQRFRP